VSDSEPSDQSALQLAAFARLEKLVRNLGEELAMFRRRALQAEARLKEIDSSSRSGDLFAEQRLGQVERENAELRTRLDGATLRTRQMLEQVRFARQQHERGEP
jgi:hypothetical protein